MAETKPEKPAEAQEPIVEPVGPPPKNNNKPLIIAIVVSAVLGLALIAAVGALTLSALGHTGKMRNAMQTERTMRPEAGTNGPMSDQRRSGRAETGPLADSSTRVSGVITAVNGDSLTVSGNGKQVTVKKTASTTIRGTSTTVAVNDTISATGTTTDGAFTATSITIRNIK